MAIVFDLMLSDDNDLIISDNDFTFTSTKSEVTKQRLGITLRTFKGEWFINRDYGIPYLQNIIGVARKKPEVDKIFISQISSDAYVKSVTTYSSTFDRYDRNYSITATIQVDEVVSTVSFDITPDKEWIYPTPDEDDPRIDCTRNDVLPYVNELYEFINFNGLPRETYSTWWNEWAGNLNASYQLITQSGEYLISQDGKNLITRNS